MTLFYEDIHQDREAALRQVCAYAGMSFEPRWLPELGRRFNRSQDVALPVEMRAYLRERLHPQAEHIEAIVGRIPPAWSKEFSPRNTRQQKG